MVSGFLQSAEDFSQRPALEVGGEAYDYAALRDRAASIAATLQLQSPGSDPPLTAVFAHRTATAFTGLLGTLMRGHGYVPLNRTLPVARTRTMLERAACQAIVCDRESSVQLPELLTTMAPVCVLLPDMEDVSELRAALPAHRLLAAGDLPPASAWVPEPVDPSTIAYLLFTSGSTGMPKGVMVSHSNVLHYVDAMVERYAIDEHDRVSQTHDLTFDVSVFDLFVSWERGACVCVPGQRTMLNPGAYIRDARLTVWFSVPSVAMFMRRLGGLKADAFPSLRWSLFAGEPLPLEVVRAWEQAAPASTIENLYGPTEATVVCVLYKWDPQTSPAECERGLLPIGRPLSGLRVLIVDEQLLEVAPGQVGELLVSGPQVTLGYWRDPERTAEAFVVPPEQDAVVHYRTGDLVRQPRDAGGPIAFLGRRDSQIKVRGVRIELGEVESALREASGVDEVVALGWPTTLVGADAVEAFIGADDVDVAAVRAALAERLPVHMVPRRVRALAQMPLNPNGKIDRAALIALLESE
jgi:amino acid adenylation domain-containing protein